MAAEAAPAITGPIYVDGGSPEAQWDCETTWEDVALAIGLPKPWIEQLRAHGTPAEPGASWGWQNPADAWKAVRHWDSEHEVRNAVWTALLPVINRPVEGYVPPDGFDDNLLLSLTALIIGKEPDDLFVTPMQCADPPWGKTRTERRLENLEYSTLQVDWGLQEIRDRIASAKQRTDRLSRNAERKRHRQEREEGRRQQEERVAVLMATVAELNERLERVEQQRQAMADKEAALVSLEPVLRVILMDPDQRINGMHAEVSLRWSSVYVRNGEAMFGCDDTEYCLKRSHLTPHLYLGYRSHRDDSDGDGDPFD